MAWRDCAGRLDLTMFTWDQIGNLGLSTAQKNKLTQAEVIGNAVMAAQPVDSSPVTPTQAKAILAFYAELSPRIQAAQAGARYVLKTLRDNAGQAAFDAVSTGSL